MEGRAGIVTIILAVLSTAITAENSSTPSLNVTVTRRDTYEILIKWEIKPADALDMFSEYKVMAESATDAYKITYEGAHVLDVNAMKATVAVHKRDHAYTICVQAVVKANHTEELKMESLKECVSTSTIQGIHPASLIALLLTLLFFLLCVVVGYVSWKCAVRKQEKDQAYDKTELTGNGDVVPLTNIED